MPRVATPERCVCVARANDCEASRDVLPFETESIDAPDRRRAELLLKQLQLFERVASVAETACAVRAPATSAAFASYDAEMIPRLKEARAVLHTTDDAGANKVLAWRLYDDAIANAVAAAARKLTPGMITYFLNHADVASVLKNAWVALPAAPSKFVVARALVDDVAAELVTPIAQRVSEECAAAGVSKERPRWVAIFRGKP